MFNRFMLCIALGIQSSFALTHAANDLEKWNSESGKVARSAMREKLKTTTYRELPNHVDSSYRSTANGGKVLRQIETNATVKGSRVGTTIEALKDVDKRAAAAKWAEKLSQGLGKDIFKQGVRLTAGGILIDEALDLMLDGIGWVIDEGGKVTKKEGDGFADSSDALAYKYNFGDQYYYYKTKQALCNHIASHESLTLISVNYDYCRLSNGKSEFNRVFSPNKSQNPNYIPNSTPPPKPSVPLREMEQEISKYFENPQSSPSKDLLIEQAEKPKGKASIMWSDDPDSEQTIYNDNKNTTDKVLQSDNPVADGLTKETPKITDGTSASGESNSESSSNTDVNETTRPNPDGSTTTTGNNTTNNTTNNTFNFELPAFCDYAAIVCDWIDWTKEEPEKEEEQEQETINDKGIFDREFDIKFEFEKSCPPDYVFNFETKYIAGSYKFTFNWLCMFFSGISYPLVFLSHCLGAWIFYEIAVRRGNQGA